MITRVELAFRDGNLGQFRSIDIFDVCDIGISRNYHNFLNDKLYPVVASDDIAASSDQQSIKHFDNVPQLCGAIEYVGNREGRGRTFFGANLENYDLDASCIDLTVNLDAQHADPCLVTIRGTVNIDSGLLPNQTIYESGTSNNTGVLNDGKLYVLGTIFDPNTLRYIGTINNGDNLRGFVVYLAGTNHFGISNNSIIVPLSERDGSFEITGVPRGRYIMRVASFNVINGTEEGTIHNINNGQAWQRTSAPVINCAGSGTYERVLDLTTATGVFDLNTVTGHGPILIASLVNIPIPLVIPIPSTTNFRFALQGYFLDNEGDSSTKEIRQGAIACERQKLNYEVLTNGLLYPAGFVVREAITDHNGYYYFIWNYVANGSQLTMQARLKNVFITIPDVCNTGFRDLSTPAGTGQIFSGSIYTTGFQGLFDAPNVPEVLVPYQNNGEIHRGLSIAETWLLFNSDQEFTENNRTIVQGRSVESTGLGLTKTLITIERNGRQEETDVNGNFAISVYCPWDKPRRDDDDVIPQYLLDKCYVYPPDPLLITLAINDFCSPFTSTNPFILSDFEYGFAGALTVQEKYLKAGGTYRFGIIYEDNHNRKSTVLEGNTLRIPFHTERGSYGRSFTSWDLNGVPPIWATHYRLVRTRDSYYRRYLQLKLTNVEYAIFDDVDSAPTITSFVAANATHILLQMPSIFDEDPDSQSATWFFRSENDRTFDPEIRDRVRFILDQNDVLVLNDGIIDVEILGKYIDAQGNVFVIIEDVEVFGTDLKEIEQGWLVELYTPKRVEDDIFYECGECHLVLDPHTANRRHSGPTQNQIIGVQPARGLLLGGDTYWRIRSFVVDEGSIYRLPVENNNMTDSFQSVNEDIGRANIRDDDFGQRFYYNVITWSDIFVPGNNVNGLSAVIGSDRQFVDVRFGIIKNLVYAADVLLAITEFKIQPYYIGKDNVLSLSGREQLGTSDRQTNAANELIQDWGTQHPCSVTKQGNYVYGFDARQGLAWRYATNGLTEISRYGL